MDDYKNILIIKLGALGDWIHSTGWFAAVRAKWPSAHITLMTASPFLKLAKASPFFDDYVIDNRTWNPCDYWHITKNILANKKYDLIIDMQQQQRTKKRYYTLARFFAKGPFVWGATTQNGLELRVTPKKHPFTWGKEQQKLLPLQRRPATLSFCKANPEVLKILPKKYVLLIPGCSPAHPYKRWPAESYRQLALKLARKNIYSVVLGTDAERPEIEQICKDNPKAVNLCNKSSLLDIPEIAQRSLAIIGNDTGPQHMAELGKVPAITLFSIITRNSQVNRENVTNIVAPEIKDIAVEEVYRRLQSLWHKA